MRRSNQIILTSLIILTLILCGIILVILLFKQSAVPQFTVGPSGLNGKDGVVNYSAIDNYIDGKIDNIPKAVDGKNAVVDYDSIMKYIDQKFASIPAPKNGFNGLDGSSCSTTQLDNGATITCTDGTSSIITNGTNGEDGKTLQLR